MKKMRIALRSNDIRILSLGGTVKIPVEEPDTNDIQEIIIRFSEIDPAIEILDDHEGGI